MSAKVSCTVLRGGERGNSRTLPDYLLSTLPNNPAAWGISPLSDHALRIQQLQVEQPSEWSQMLKEDLEAWISEVRGAEEIVLSLYPYVEDIEEDGGDVGAFAEMLSNRINAGVAYIAVMGNEDALLTCNETELGKAKEIYVNYFL